MSLMVMVILLSDHLCQSYNLDLTVPVVKQDPTGQTESYFGYSLAQHVKNGYQQDGTPVYSRVLLVGAPRRNTTLDGNKVRTGAAYQCPITSAMDDCSSIDIELPTRDADNEDQWLGVSVASQAKPDGRAVVCAHRFKLVTQYSFQGTGYCATLDNNLDHGTVYLDFDPCYNKSPGARRAEYGICQTGTSVDVNSDGSVLLGIPGAFNQRGSILHNTLFDSLTVERKNIWSPVETPPPIDRETIPPSIYAYMGYSTLLLSNSVDDTLYMVGGAPRSKENGQVFLFILPNDDKSWMQSKLEWTLTGPQFGAYFGFSLTATDLNGDGRDDLVVGSPTYQEETVGGAFYVYITKQDTGKPNFEEPIEILSPRMSSAECKSVGCHNRWFAHSLAAAGDLNKDGYGDIAVGAPYEGAGVVYIYHGAADGLVMDPVQVIRPSDLTTTSLISGFGVSLSGGMDMDDNTYPDLAVGAHTSGSTILLRARPVINLISEWEVDPKQINHKESCSFNGQDRACFLLTIKLKFTTNPSDLFEELDITCTLREANLNDEQRSRITIGDSQQTSVQNTISIKQSDFSSKTDVITISNTNTDILRPIIMEVNCWLQNTLLQMNPGEPLPNINAYPVLAPSTSHTDIAIEFQKNCGEDEICESDLSLDMATLQLEKDISGKFLLKLGTIRELELLTVVSNKGEDAHAASLQVSLPAGLLYIGAQKDGKSHTCSVQDITVTCLLGNPLKTNEQVQLLLKIDPTGVSPSVGNLLISVEVNTSSVDLDIADNSEKLAVRVVTETDLSLTGFSDPSEVVASSLDSNATESYEQIMINHTFYISNVGNAAVDTVSVDIAWPYKFNLKGATDRYLLYLASTPEPAGVCNIDPEYLDPLKIKEGNEPRRGGLVKSDAEVSIYVLGEGSKQVVRILELSCEGDKPGAKCIRFSCTVSKLAPGEAAPILITSYLWIWEDDDVFRKNQWKPDIIRVYSSGGLDMQDMETVLQTSTSNDNHKIQVDILMEWETQGVAIWVFVLAGLGGLILLIIAVLVLWKCGFFKRQRHDNVGVHQGAIQKKETTEKGQYAD